MKKLILLVSIYAIAMAFMESAVVVYLREIYYPDGFSFPLVAFWGKVAITELFRELATMVMLLAVALIAARRRTEIFAWFIYSFAVWDIFYYIFLKVLLGWPSSLLTWDILFLIPTTWTGPVIAPVINSLTMILLALVIIYYSRKGMKASLRPGEWILLIIGSLITIFSYIMDYAGFMMEEFTLSSLLFTPGKEEIMNRATAYVPRSFNWYLFGLGELMFLLSIALFNRRHQGSSGS